MKESFHIKKSIVIVLAILTGACGGGSKSKVENFTLSQDLFAITIGQDFEQNILLEAEGRIAEPDSEVYVMVDTSTTELILSATVSISEVDTSGTLTLTTEAASYLPVGTHSGKVSISACKDVNCNSHYTGSPQEIDIIYTVMPNENPDIYCAHQDGYIFSECVDRDWIGITGWQVFGEEGFFQQFSYLDGNNNFLVNWDVVDTAEDGFNNVVDVRYSDQHANGQIRFPVAGPYREAVANLTAYAGGTLDFDIRVLDWARADRIDAQVECLWPCTTGNVELALAVTNEWQHISLPVDDLVSRGLDLQQVDLGLVLSPEWDSMNGVHFQVDNIRYIPL